MAQVCFEESTLVLLILGFSLLMIFSTGINYQGTKTRKIYVRQPERRIDSMLEGLHRIFNPLIPPVRTNTLTHVGNMRVNIPTRGEYPDFNVVGFLRNDEDDAMILYGRRVDTNRYEYYTHHKDNNLIKIPIERPQHREIFNGDSLTINGIQYTATIYDMDGLRYIPLL